MEGRLWLARGAETFCTDSSSSPGLLVPLFSVVVLGPDCGVCHPGRTLFCAELQPDLKGTGHLIVTLDSSP